MEEKELTGNEQIRALVKRTVIWFIGLTALFALSAFVITPMIVSKIFVVAVSGTSMQPVLEPEGSYVILKADEPKRGDLVVANSPDAWMKKFAPDIGSSEIIVKRIVALPGDEIQMNGEHLQVNGEDGPVIGVSDTCDPIDSKLTVPDGKIFAVGDNRATSFDSMAAWCAGSEDLPFYVEADQVLTTGTLPLGSKMFGEMIK